jgi:hypothetical protein
MERLVGMRYENRKVTTAGLWALVLLLSSFTWAQSPEPNSTVPSLVNYNGTLTDASGKPLTVISGVTFSLYKDSEGGASLWMETQNVRPDRLGHYTVQLGSTTSAGLPSEVFMSGEARWLGVQLAGEAEQPRVLLVAVPYAMKAGDAATIGGLPPSAFVMATSVSANGYAAGDAAATSGASSSAAPPTTSSNVTTAGGTVNAIPLFTTTTNIQNSILTQNGTTTLNVTGKLNLPALAAATAAAGKNSRPESFVASVFNSSTSAPVNQTFQLQAEAAGNDTTTPSGTLNLLYGSGTTAPAETGLKISNKGLITFATGQAFPGTGKGTITGITTASGSGLTGGGTSGTLTLGLTNSCSKNQTLLWSGSVWACASSGSGTITSVAAGTGLTGGGTSGNVTLNVDTTKTPQLNIANNFTASQSVSGNISATGGLSGSSGTFTGSGGNAVLNVILNGSGGSPYAIVGTSHAAGSGAAVLGQNLAATGQSVGVEGFSAATKGIGVYGQYNSPNSLTGVGSNDAGVWGDGGASDFGTGVLGTTDSGDAVVGINNDFGDAAILGVNKSSHDNAWGMWASSASPTGVGILGTAVNLSGTYLAHVGVQPFGVIGTVADVSGGPSSIGVWGATDAGYAVLGENTSTAAPAGAFLNLSNVAGNPAFEAGSSIGLCTVDTSANLVCAGSITTAVQAGSAKRVAMYSLQSPENWLEDFGSGELSAGRAEIALDPTFAGTVSGTGDYHIFLTPNGDCKGLYVEAKTAAGFVVRELGGGSSSVSFDFRVVAKRRGYETVRLTDVTEAQERLMKQIQLVTQAKNLDPAKAEIRDKHRFRVTTKSSADEGELTH